MHAEKPKVLFVEDDEELREALLEYFDNTGLEVCPAADAAGAMLFAETFHPDVLLTDLNVPGAQGFDFIEQFEKQFPECLIFIHSGDTSFHAGSQICTANIPLNHIFYKPADLGKLVLTIKSVVISS